ncbi:MAG: FimV/HubP family polar landmark protein [Pseudomonadota bacterium]
MVRKRSIRFAATGIFIAMVMVTIPLRVNALSLGDLVVQSPPGKPLRAMIPVTLEAEESLAELRVSVASEADYVRQELEKPSLLQGVRIALQARGDNRGRIILSGESLWQGEEVHLLLQLHWPQGKVSRHFRILPVNGAEAQKKARYVEVAENESLANIAMRLSEHSNRSFMHMMVALYRTNPEAFYRDNLNNLKSGVRLRVPTSDELYQLSDAEVFATLREHEERLNQSREPKSAKEEKVERLRTENSQIERRNRELKERLAQIEQQMGSVSRQVLEHKPTAKPVPAAPEPADEPLEPAPTPVKEPSDAKEPDVVQLKGLSLTSLLLMMLTVTMAAAGIWRFAPQSGKGE